MVHIVLHNTVTIYVTLCFCRPRLFVFFARSRYNNLWLLRLMPLPLLLLLPLTVAGSIACDSFGSTLAVHPAGR